jgi:autotransporter-associated beta strand protein
MLSNSTDTGYIDLVVTNAGPATLSWNNAGGASPSDGQTWDIGTNNNWNNGTATTVYADGSNVVFSDSNNATSNGGANPNAYNVTLNTVVKPASITVNNSTGNYSISGTGTIGGTASLTKSGSGTLTLSTPNTYSGGTIVSAGLLEILPTSSTTSALPMGAVTINGGMLQLATNVTAGSQPSPTPASNVNITSLSITGSGQFDINNNHIIVNYGGGADPIASIAAMIKSGFNGGAWTGAGIMSTTAQSNAGSYGIGYADSADPGNPAGLASGQIEIMYTLLGDANLDGAVNGSDFAILATNFNKAVSGWDAGDFNYDGAANGSDFASLASNFNKGASQAALDAFATANGLSVSVPEPASCAIVLMTAAGVLAKRRRSRVND